MVKFGHTESGKCSDDSHLSWRSKLLELKGSSYSGVETTITTPTSGSTSANQESTSSGLGPAGTILNLLLLLLEPQNLLIQLLLSINHLLSWTSGTVKVLPIHRQSTEKYLQMVLIKNY